MQGCLRSNRAHRQHAGVPVPQACNGPLVLGTLLQEPCCSTLVSNVKSWFQTCRWSLPNMSTKALVMMKARLKAMGTWLGMAAAGQWPWHRCRPLSV